MRVAAAQGLESVSLRHVADEAGVSSGMVQHYFRTKDEMMVFALEIVRERGSRRLSAAVEALGADPSPRDLLLTVFTTLLPLDEQRRAEGRVMLAFLAYTAVRPAAGLSLREDTAQLVGFLAERIGAAQATGAARPGIDPAGTAAGLLAAMEGLGLYLIAGYYEQDTALRALHAQLAAVFLADGWAGPGGSAGLEGPTAGGVTATSGSAR